MGGDLGSECAKAASIIQQFISKGPGVDNVIPPNIVSSARGIAVLQVVRVGFHFSGRLGTGVIVARLPDGSWSAPSVIKTAGIGVGFLIGAEMTDFVIILNSDQAVTAFMQENVTLGGNLSVAAGPTGRTAEAGASLISPAPVYSYSKTKGLFVGASLEGSVIMTGKDENLKFYGQPFTTQQILGGEIARPQAATPLYASLQQRIIQEEYDTILNATIATSTASHQQPPDLPAYTKSNDAGAAVVTARPLPLTPTGAVNFKCVALYDYKSDVEGDLQLRAGEEISVLEKKADGWWVGKSGDGRVGSFPSNYVRVLG